MGSQSSSVLPGIFLPFPPKFTLKTAENPPNSNKKQLKTRPKVKVMPTGLVAVELIFSFHLFIYGEGSPSTQVSVFKGPSHKIKLKVNYKINIKTIRNITKKPIYNLKPIYNIYYIIKKEFPKLFV